MDMHDVQTHMNQGLNFGMMNAMRTGNPILDVAICMMVPVVLGMFMGNNHQDPLSKRIQETIRDLIDWITGNKTYIRIIDYEDRSGRSMDSDDRSALDTAERNNILQKAVKLYIQEVGKLSIDQAEVYLLPQNEVKLEKDRWGDVCIFSGSYKQLLSYRVTRLPRKGHWVQIDNGDPPISFRQTVTVDEEGEGNGRRAIRTITFEIRAKGPKAEARVDAFVTDAFDWYKKKKGEEVDKSRYLYQPVVKNVSLLAEPSSDDEGDARKYKRYLLADNKSFDTLFFPEKDALIKLIDDFKESRGKFAIPGFPNKLGVLLDGPPGTGKTSLIKAMAIHLNRHIVSVSLEKIRTNQELMDMMFDLTYEVRGEDEPIRMKFNEVIFVMEDVDCASSVVYARKGLPSASTMATMPVGPAPAAASSEKPATNGASPEKPVATAAATLQPLGRAWSVPADPMKFSRNTPFSTARMLRKMSFVSEDSSKDDDEEESEPVAPRAAPAAERAKPLEEVREVSKEDSEEEEEKPVKKTIKKKDKDGKPTESVLYDDSLDKLNLSGLLNVLDGVVDTPGRVLIMTTNHPEKLDPALIRPGRINKRIHLGYVTAETLLHMAKHYVCRETELPANSHGEAEALCKSGRGITPAWVEQCSAESDDFPSLVHKLWVLKNALPPGAASPPPSPESPAASSPVNEGAAKRW